MGDFYDVGVGAGYEWGVLSGGSRFLRGVSGYVGGDGGLWHEVCVGNLDYFHWEFKINVY